MSAKTSTPPQAYTRETLTKAFEWMKTQPESVKDKVTSADALVRLYLHSKRFGSPTLALLDDRQPNLEDLISVENFKQDLKDLAQGLKQFEDSSSSPPTQGASMSYTPPSPSHQSSRNPSPPSFASPAGYSPEPAPQAFQPSWDEKTYMAVKATKERFNLSSDQEALRLLVATGFDRLRESFLKGF